VRIAGIAVAATLLIASASGATTAPRIVAKIKVAATAAPCAAVGGGSSVWVTEYGSPYVLQIDPKTNTVRSRTRIGDGSCGAGFGDGSIWIEDTSSNTVSRVSVTTRRRTAISVGTQPYDATFAYGAAWVTAYASGELERVDPRRNKVVKRIPLASATGVVAAFGSVWATGSDGVIRVDPATNAVVARIQLPNGGWTAASADAVWITSGGALTRIDPSTNAVVATITLPTMVLGDPAVVAGQLWVPEVRQNTLAIVDPATNRVTRTVKVGAGPFVVTEIGGDAWVPSWKGNDIWRLRP
jgi:YVTN family beta-propeller protein